MIWFLYHSSASVTHFPANLASRQSWFPCRLRAHLRAVLVLTTFALAVPWLRGQTSAKPTAKPTASSAPSKVMSFRLIQEKDGQAVEILSTKPLVPAIQEVSNPERLVIDLPNARLNTEEKRISVQADQITTIRANQFQQNPPVTRVVVDLLAPRTYTWDAAGNRLVVHLGKAPTQAGSSPFEPPAVPSLTSAPQPAVAAVRAAGPLALAGKEGGTGSSITAGADTAVVSLSSGGEVHVCPGTTIAVTPSQNRHNLMLSMNTGALEAHFVLDASSDSVMTPDFRILLVGPGEFHYAISADNRGNTCVRALPGNTASAIVSELLGDRTYQVKATDQLVFRSGQLDRVDMAVPLECGCPPPRDSPMRATTSLPMQSEVQKKSTNAALPPVNPNPAQVVEAAHGESAPSNGAGVAAAAAPLDASVAPNELHVQVEAPLVFRATGPPPAPVEDVRALPLDSRPGIVPTLSPPLPPPGLEEPRAAATETASAKRAPAHGFFRKLRGFFASLFR